LRKPHLSVHKWQVLPLTIAPQQYHIDLNEQLLKAALPGEPATLYWSQAEPAGLVLGFAQKHSILNPALAAQQFPIYHRRAGGTAVLVGSALLSLDVVLPAGHPLILPDIVESYYWLGTLWVETLGHLGVETRIVSPQEAHAQRDILKHEETRERESILTRACFGSLSPYEVVAGQRKVVGLDMIRRRAGSLLQAGLLLQWEIEPLVELLGHTPEEQAILREGLPKRAVGLDTLAGRAVTAEEVITAFEETLFNDWNK
jgi:lipoate-protein ligase A